MDTSREDVLAEAIQKTQDFSKSKRKLRPRVPGFTESIVEKAALGWLAALDCSVLHGPDICGRRIVTGAQRSELP
jgi:hypothetical protein